MKRHISMFSESINESLGRGSVILIKGKPHPDGKKRLYAAYVDGFAEFHPGAVMLFLSPEFYRIKLVDGQLRAFRIDYNNEESLKKVLNMKTAGRISIVRNSNKTPLHWKTTKHSNVSSAIREIESDLISDEYLLESTESSDFNKLDHAKKYTYFLNELLKECLNSIFFSKKSVEIYSYKIDEDFDDKISSAEDNPVTVEWNAEFEILFSNRPELDEYFEYFKMPRMIDLTIYFNSDVDAEHWSDPGSYWTPGDSGWDIKSVETSITEIYIDGDSTDNTAEVTEIFNSINSKIKEFDAHQLNEYIKKNIKRPFYLD